jgi:hypothetical protein
MTAVARLIAPVALALGMIVVTTATPGAEPDVLAAGRVVMDAEIPAPEIPAPELLALVAAAPEVRSLGMAQADPGVARVRPGARDDRGCRSLSVRRGGKVLLRIPSHAAGCSTNRDKVRIGKYLYFDWGVTKKRGGERWRRSDLWVTDGTRRGTQRIVTLRSGTRRGTSCAVRWEWVGGMSIAAAQWCWNARTGKATDGAIRIITKGRYMRTSPVPQMQRFAVAGRRMVTTGFDKHGRELWIHDSRMRRVDLRPGAKGSNPRRFTPHGKHKVRFIANDGTGKALWVTDGTAAGTRKVR